MLIAIDRYVPLFILLDGAVANGNLRFTMVEIFVSITSN